MVMKKKSNYFICLRELGMVETGTFTLMKEALELWIENHRYLKIWSRFVGRFP